MTIDELEQTGLPVVHANHEGFITFVNRGFEESFGWSAEDLVGRPLVTIIPENLRNAHDRGIDRLRTTGISNVTRQYLTLKVLCKDGSEVDAEHYIVGEPQGEGWRFGATIRRLPF